MDTTQSLPTELRLQVLEYLSYRGILNAAYISRSWRAAARLDSRFFVVAKFSPPTGDSKSGPYDPQRVETFAEENGYCLGLAFSLDGVSKTVELDGDEYRAVVKAFIEFLQRLSHLLDRIVHLRIDVPDELRDAAAQVLTSPAPRLRYFGLACNPLSAENPPYRPIAELISVNPFSGVSYQLRTVLVQDVDVGCTVISAFAGVRDVRVWFSRAGGSVPDMNAEDIRIDIAVIFPSCQDLRLYANTEAYIEYPMTLGSLKLRMLHYADKSLTLGDNFITGELEAALTQSRCFSLLIGDEGIAEDFDLEELLEYRSDMKDVFMDVLTRPLNTQLTEILVAAVAKVDSSMIVARGINSLEFASELVEHTLESISELEQSTHVRLDAALLEEFLTRDDWPCLHTLEILISDVFQLAALPKFPVLDEEDEKERAARFSLLADVHIRAVDRRISVNVSDIRKLAKWLSQDCREPEQRSTLHAHAIDLQLDEQHQLDTLVPVYFTSAVSNDDILFLEDLYMMYGVHIDDETRWNGIIDHVNIKRCLM